CHTRAWSMASSDWRQNTRAQAHARNERLQSAWDHRRLRERTNGEARGCPCAASHDPLLEKRAERVGLVGAEGAALGVAAAAVEGERFGLTHAGLQAQDAHALGLGRRLQTIEDAAAELEPAR